MEQLVVVNRDALRAVVDYLWEDERVHYIEKCPRRTWFMDVRSFSDDHIFHSLITLAVACGYIESVQVVWDGIKEEMGVDSDEK